VTQRQVPKEEKAPEEQKEAVEEPKVKKQENPKPLKKKKID
jgi:hypothetical protein